MVKKKKLFPFRADEAALNEYYARVNKLKAQVLILGVVLSVLVVSGVLFLAMWLGISPTREGALVALVVIVLGKLFADVFDNVEATVVEQLEKEGEIERIE